MKNIRVIVKNLNSSLLGFDSLDMLQDLGLLSTGTNIQNFKHILILCQT
jgi:hypothetical protein